MSDKEKEEWTSSHEGSFSELSHEGPIELQPIVEVRQTRPCQRPYYGHLICGPIFDKTEITVKLIQQACDECQCEPEKIEANARIALANADRKPVPTPGQKIVAFDKPVCNQEEPKLPEYWDNCFPEKNITVDLPIIRQELSHSYVIHSYNRKEYIQAIYQRALNTNPIELIVIDDGSTDGAKEEWETIANRDHKVELHCLDNWHEIHAYDYAIRKCKGDLVVILQSDNAPPSSPKWWLDAQSLFRCLPNLSVLGGLNSVAWFSEKPKRQDYGLRMLKSSAPSINGVKFAYSPGTAVGPFILIRDDYLRVGGFELIHDKGDVSMMHDHIYCHKIWKMGKEVGTYIPHTFWVRSQTSEQNEHNDKLKDQYRASGKIDHDYMNTYPDTMRTINSAVRHANHGLGNYKSDIISVKSEHTVSDSKHLCTDCQFYRDSCETGEYCVYLTRHVSLNNWIADGKHCPMNKF